MGLIGENTGWTTEVAPMVEVFAAALRYKPPRGPEPLIVSRADYDEIMAVGLEWWAKLNVARAQGWGVYDGR